MEAKIAEPLGQIDKITIIGGDGDGNGINQVAGNVPVVMAKLFESMKEATGIDLSEIIKADTYDAKVNRNVNVTGLDDINLVVKTEESNFLMQLEVGTVCFFLSACVKKNIMGAGLGLTLVLFAADMMCRIVPAIEDLKYITPFYYANAADIFTGP